MLTILPCRTKVQTQLMFPHIQLVKMMKKATLEVTLEYRKEELVV